MMIKSKEIKTCHEMVIFTDELDFNKSSYRVTLDYLLI